jgi:hypothetical protein
MTGSESLPVYSIWEVERGYPLYQWPYKDHYQLTLYNFGFYDSYAFLLNLAHVRGPEILLYGRLLTTFFCAIGICLQTRLIKALLPGPTGYLEEISLWLVSICTWLNTTVPGFYDLSVRADVLAVTLCTAATLFFLYYLRQESVTWLLLASLGWILAWCIKQTAIFSLLGALAYLLCAGRWQALAVLLFTYGPAVAAILGLSSPEYRWNILKAPTIDPFELSRGLPSLAWGVVATPFAWVALLTFPLLLKLESRAATPPGFQTLPARMRPKGDLAGLTVLAFILICGGAPAALTLCRKGGSLNYLFEVFVFTSSLSYLLFFRLTALCREPAARRLGYLAGALLLAMCLYPAAELALHRLGPMQRATRDDMAKNQQFGDFLTTLPKPLLLNDEIWNLPWFASNNSYPLIKVDPIWYPDACDKNLIQDGGIEGLIRKHYYASIYVKKNSSFYQTALASHYVPVLLPDQPDSYLDSLGHPVTDCVLLHAPPSP